MTVFPPPKIFGGNSLNENPVYGRLVGVSDLTDVAVRICSGPYTPAILKGRRCAENFVAIDFLVGDVDSGTTLTAVMRKLRAGGYGFILAPTKSHMKKKNGVVAERFRVVLLLSHRITRARLADLAATWGALNDLLGGVLDRAAADCSRFYYRSTCVAWNCPGRPFPVAKGKAQRKPRTRPQTPAAPYDFPNRLEYCATALCEEASKLAATPNGSRNHQAHQAAVKLSSLNALAGLPPEDDALNALRAAGEAAGLGKTELERALRNGWHYGQAHPRDPATVDK